MIIVMKLLLYIANSAVILMSPNINSRFTSTKYYVNSHIWFSGVGPTFNTTHDQDVWMYSDGVGVFHSYFPCVK